MALKAEVKHDGAFVPVEVETVVPGDVIRVRAGDIIPLDVEESIIASVDNVPVMECKYGALNNQYALKVERMLSLNEGEGHA